MHVVALGRPVERREAVGLDGIDVDPLRNQRSDGGDILPLRRIDQLVAGSTKDQRRSEDAQGDEQRTTTQHEVTSLPFGGLEGRPYWP